MIRISGSWLLLACTVSLGACNTGGTDSGSPTFAEDATGAQPSPTNPADVENAHAVLNNDGLQAPPAPTLHIDSSPGSLTFSWRVQSEDKALIKHATLYGLNRRNGAETLISSELNIHTMQYELPIISHELAWNDMQYRVELCNTNTQCVSSNYMPIASLLAKSLVNIQASHSTTNDQYPLSTAINAQGNIIATLSPGQSNLFIYFELPDGWVQGSELALFSGELSGLQVNSLSSVSMSFSSSGDTLAVATVSKQHGALVVVFDRFGENWIQTAQFKPWDIPQQILAGAQWSSNAIKIQLRNDGEQLLLSLQNSNNGTAEQASALSQLSAMTRSGATWGIDSTLPFTLSGTRLPAFSASADLQTVFLLSEHLGDTQLSLYKFKQRQWQWIATQAQPMLLATSDAQVLASANGDAVLVGGWENSTVQKTPVLWRYLAPNNTIELLDSLREPTSDEPSAEYRLASDDNLQHIAFGWQSEDNARLSVFNEQQQTWVNSFRLPENLTGSTTSALAQSVRFSADGSALLISSAQPFASENPSADAFIRVFK